MATPAQIAANQANAQKSTGPRSVEGKSVSRFNALKHGIDAASIVIPGEDPADYDALADHYLQEFRPKSASESFHVGAMLRADWQKGRLPRLKYQPPPPPPKSRVRPRRVLRQVPRLPLCQARPRRIGFVTPRRAQPPPSPHNRPHFTRGPAAN